MQHIAQLIKKDLIVDWRQQNPISGILLYLASTIFATYMAFKGFVSVEVWNALFWIILLFTSINAISKSFIQEERRSHYYYFLCKPSEIILGKLIYSFLYLLSIAAISLIVYAVLLGNPIINYPIFILNLTLGCLGLSSAFTMVSSIAFRTSNRSIMMAVLGFPVIIPVLILAISNSFKILDGYILMQIQGNIATLFSVDVIIIALTFVLFPFTWKS
ncbi:heme exporter protein B [Ekhidna lutea]|uniref:Heme exporter protein B n=1 Tax=Ekhidna lutea TaxID=447679 RepID=A0A239FEZ8_EKHLU|nr:heme exporter protein CcmB [Ekhidna lutea]SNS55341.1 heme exporter protein B [Ekhidna lutea]